MHAALSIVLAVLFALPLARSPKMLALAALCIYNVFGHSFFFLVNAIYYASYCDDMNNALLMFLFCFIGSVIACVACVGILPTFTARSTPRRMMATGMFHAMYCVFGMHALFSSFDARFVCMACTVVGGTLLAFRYDASDALIAWMLSFVVGLVFFVLEHSVLAPHAIEENTECDTWTACVALIAGGIWLIAPLLYSFHFVLDDTVVREQGGKLFFCAFGILYTFNVFTQVADRRSAWVPTLITGAHASMLTDLSSKPATITTIIAQTVLLVGSMTPAVFLLVSEVVNQKRPLKSGDTAMWLTSIVLICSWAVFMLHADFERLAYIYIAAFFTMLIVPFVTEFVVGGVEKND